MFYILALETLFVNTFKVNLRKFAIMIIEIKYCATFLYRLRKNEYSLYILLRVYISFAGFENMIR